MYVLSIGAVLHRRISAFPDRRCGQSWKKSWSCPPVSSSIESSKKWFRSIKSSRVSKNNNSEGCTGFRGSSSLFNTKRIFLPKKAAKSHYSYFRIVEDYNHTILATISIFCILYTKGNLPVNRLQFFRFRNVH